MQSDLLSHQDWQRKQKKMESQGVRMVAQKLSLTVKRMIQEKNNNEKEPVIFS